MLNLEFHQLPWLLTSALLVRLVLAGNCRSQLWYKGNSSRHQDKSHGFKPQLYLLLSPSPLASHLWLSPLACPDPLLQAP